MLDAPVVKNFKFLAHHELDGFGGIGEGMAIQIARDNADDTSADLFRKLLKDEEEHVDWLEAQLHQIKEMGYERYLSNMTEGPKD